MKINREPNPPELGIRVRFLEINGSPALEFNKPGLKSVSLLSHLKW